MSLRFDEPVRSIVDRKGSEIFWVPVYASVRYALDLMAQYDIGALLVKEDGLPAGLFSERDYARKVILLGRSSLETSVHEVMSLLIRVAPTDTVESCLQTMTVRRVRHLLVADGLEVAGLVSIGDLVNWMISVQADTINHLTSYFASEYPG